MTSCCQNAAFSWNYRLRSSGPWLLQFVTECMTHSMGVTLYIPPVKCNDPRLTFKHSGRAWGGGKCPETIFKYSAIQTASKHGRFFNLFWKRILWPTTNKKFYNIILWPNTVKKKERARERRFIFIYADARLHSSAAGQMQVRHLNHSSEFSSPAPTPSLHRGRRDETSLNSLNLELWTFSDGRVAFRHRGIYKPTAVMQRLWCNEWLAGEMHWTLLNEMEMSFSSGSDSKWLFKPL